MLCLFVLMVHISVVGGTQNESYVHIHVHICIYRTTRQKSVHIYKIHWELYIYLFIYYIYLFICLNTCAAVVSAIPEAQATTMDFRKVEKQFRPAALLLQVVLCSFLLCYWGYSFKQILESSADPPVETTTVQWRKNLGLWALCSPGSLFGVGAASGGEVWGREKALTGAEPSAKEKLNGSLAGFSDGHFALLTCSFLDLTDFEIKVPFFFSLCIDSNTTSLLLLKEEGQWRYVTHQSPGTYNFYTLKKAIHGWNWGYSTSENSIFLINLLRGQSSHRTDRTYECSAGMTYFGSPGGEASAVRFAAQDPMVIVYHKQGIMPQLFKLMSSVGGYMSCLTLIFLSCFVRRYPESGVAQIYEARTFFFKMIWSSNVQRCPEDKKPDEGVPKPLPLPPGLFTQLGRDTE